MEFDIDKIKAIQDPTDRMKAMNEYQEWMEAQRKADKKNKRSEDNRVYREKHRETMRIASKRWKEAHKAKMMEKKREWELANRDKVKASYLRATIKRKEFLIQRKITELNLLKKALTELLGGDTNAKDLPERTGDPIRQEEGRTETDFADAERLLHDSVEQQDEKEGDSKGTEALNPDNQKTGEGIRPGEEELDKAPHQ